MDFKVYTKEEVKQPNKTEYVITPNIIDIYPIITQRNNKEFLSGAQELNVENELLEQSVALATIWQKGLDPLDVDDGIRWSETILGEVNVVQLMEDITNAVSAITPTVEVVFDTVKDTQGNTLLKYTLQATA